MALPITRKKRDNNAEARIQGDVVEYLRWTVPDVTLWHTPNGGELRRGEGARRQWQGVLAGVLDLTLVWGPPPRCAFLEVKTEKGRLSPAQKSFCAALDRMGFQWAVVRGIDDTFAALQQFGIEALEPLPLLARRAV